MRIPKSICWAAGCLTLAAWGVVGCSGSEDVTGPTSQGGPMGSGGLGAVGGDLGACCFVDGSCSLLSEEDCTTAGGGFQGTGTLCEPNPCPQPEPTGACCFVDGSCAVTTAVDCADSSGTYQGDETTCDPDPCATDDEAESCGLGYWKNHHDAWELTGLAPGDLVSASFSLPPELDDLGDDSLDDALRYPGGSGAMGGARLLLRDAVVALLNASHPDVAYGLTADEIRVVVEAALATLDRQAMQDARHDVGPRNGGECPLER